MLFQSTFNADEGAFLRPQTRDYQKCGFCVNIYCACVHYSHYFIISFTPEPINAPSVGASFAIIFTLYLKCLS